MNPSAIVGVDVGGTKIAAGWMRWPGEQRHGPRVISTEAARGGRAVLDDVLGLARELASEAQKGGASVAAIGLGICELVDREGRLASANCIPWLDLPAREELAVVAPTVFEADVRAAALAEARWGAGRGFHSFLYVTVGTGISCCLMLAGQPYLGARGATGTMASSPLGVPCERCGHVNTATLEEIAAGPALVARFRAAGGDAHSGLEVLAAAVGGDERARHVVETASGALESQVALLVNTLDPEAVVIGGGLGLSEGPYWEHFIAATRRHIWSDLHRGMPILRAALGTDAGWMGAALRAASTFWTSITDKANTGSNTL